MVSGSTVLCLFLFVAGCICAPTSSFQFTHAGNITYDYALNFTIPAINHADASNFSITSTVAVVVCIQAKFRTPSAQQLSNASCTHFFNLTAGSSEHMIDLRNFMYFVSVYFAEPVDKDNVTFVTTVLKGSNCTQNTFYDDVAAIPICRAANLSLALGVNSVTFEEDLVPSTKYYVLTVPDLGGSLTVSPVKSPLAAEFPMVIVLRYSGNPSQTSNDANDLLGPAKFDLPRPGQWVIGIIGNEPGTYEFNVSLVACPANSGLAGPECNIPYAEAKENMTLVAFPNKYSFWVFNATKGHGLNVSVTTEDRTHIPNLYVSKGNLPTGDDHDISNCNQEACDLIRSIRTEIAATSEWELWFISVTASVTEGNTTYGIWFNETCPTTCETDNHGFCEEEGPKTGVCTCQLDYTGIDCSISHGLGAQYIVLIIIVALVVASAIIGFVAWAYMRRKRVNYELVS